MIHMRQTPEWPTLQEYVYRQSLKTNIPWERWNIQSRTRWGKRDKKEWIIDEILQMMKKWQQGIVQSKEN